MTLDEVAAVERLEFRAFPAAEEIAMGGWKLRATEHATARRVNSATTPLAEPADLASELASIESFYRDREQDSILRILSPAPAVIDHAAAERGYTQEATTFVMVGDLDGAGHEKDVSVHSDPAGEWAAAKQAWVGMTAAQVDSWQRRAAVIPGRVGYVLLRCDRRPAAIGMGVVDEGWLGVFDVNTHPDHRRTGLASRVMRAMLAWAARESAVRSYLQVQADNTPALALYRKLGYEPAYRYWYRRRLPPAARRSS